MSAMAAIDEDAADALERSPPSVARVRDAAREEAETPEDGMGAIVERDCPAPLAMSCCGVDDAAALAMAAGEDVSRFKDEAGSAERCGTAPVPAPSGKASGRTRLSGGGGRSASSALRLTATRGIRFGPETQRHMERRCSGKGAPGKKEAIRRLRRYVARVALRAPDAPGPRREGQGLKGAGRSAGVRQRQVAEATGATAACISNVETGRVSSRPRAFGLYAEWAENGMPLDVGAEEGGNKICS